MAARTLSRRALRMGKSSGTIQNDWDDFVAGFNANATLWNNVKTALLAVCTKLDADAGVTDVNYNSTTAALTGMGSTADSITLVQ